MAVTYDPDCRQLFEGTTLGILCGLRNESNHHIVMIISSSVTSVEQLVQQCHELNAILPGGLDVLGIIKTGGSPVELSRQATMDVLKTVGSNILVDIGTKTTFYLLTTSQLMPVDASSDRRDLESHILRIPVNIICARDIVRRELTDWFNRSVEFTVKQSLTQESSKVSVHHALVQTSDWRRRYTGPKPVSIKGTVTLICTATAKHSGDLRAEFLTSLLRRLGRPAGRHNCLIAQVRLSPSRSMLSMVPSILHASELLSGYECSLWDNALNGGGSEDLPPTVSRLRDIRVVGAAMVAVLALTAQIWFMYADNN